MPTAGEREAAAEAPWGPMRKAPGDLTQWGESGYVLRAVSQAQAEEDIHSLLAVPFTITNTGARAES